MKKVAGVIVTYNNVDMLKDLLCDLLAQTRPLDEIIVVDNASSDGTEKMLKREFPRLRYIRLAENTGSAGGYYEGIKAAIENNDFIWTLDDDVSLKNDSLDKVLKEFNKLENYGKVGAVRSVSEKYRQSMATKIDFFAWRGTLIKTEAVKDAGLPRRDYFIYSDDLEYSLRLAKKGYIFYWVPLSKCNERRISRKTNNKIFGKAIKIYSEPFRLYYAFRNEIATCLRYKCLNRLTRILLYALKVSLYILFFYKRNCLEKLKAIMEGLRDGFRGRLGKNIKYLQEADG